MLLLLGDNVYPAGDPTQLAGTVFEPFADVLDDGTELLAILGNHDVTHGDAQLAALGMPGRWWSESSADDVLIVGLDSNRWTTPTQLAWLEETLRGDHGDLEDRGAAPPAVLRRVPGLEPRRPRRRSSRCSSATASSSCCRATTTTTSGASPINGVTYVVTGAAAGTRRTGEDDFTAVSFSWHSFVELGIYPDRLVGRALNQDDRVADEWTLSP